MDFETFQAHAQTLAGGLGNPPPPEGVTVCAQEPARPHDFVPGERTYVEVRAVPAPEETAPRQLDLYYGSFVEAAACEAAFDTEQALERALVYGFERLREDDAADASAEDEALFEAHARFRRGLPVVPGWYRRGERLAAGAWAVDLDVFVEIALRTEAWETLRNRPIALTILGEDFEIEIPREASLDEAWTLEECGLFEPDPGSEAQGAEAKEGSERTGRYGDLYILPLVI